MVEWCKWLAVFSMPMRPCRGLGFHSIFLFLCVLLIFTNALVLRPILLWSSCSLFQSPFIVPRAIDELIYPFYLIASRWMFKAIGVWGEGQKP